MTQLQFKTKPYQHQLDILEATKDKPYHAYLLEMGTGKSKISLDLAAYLYNCDKIQQVLIITKNGVDQQFVDEQIPRHLPLLETQFIADYWRDSVKQWPIFKKMRPFLKEELIILGINCEALGTKKGFQACKEFAARAPTLLIVDESQEFKGMKAIRTKNLLSFVNKFPFRRIMTGTPTGGNPVDLYAQMNILSDDILPKSIWAFEYQYCVKQKQNIWIKDKKTGKAIQRAIQPIVGYKNLDKLEKVISPYVSRKTKEECLDLPPKIYVQVPFVLSVPERQLYDKIKDQVLAEVAPGKYVDTTMAITKLIRLQQVTCGFINTEDLVTGERVQSILPNPARLNALLGKVEQVQGKALIWATFTTSINQIMEVLKSRFGEEAVVRYDGVTPDKQKQENKLRFKSDPAVKFLVGHPKAGGVGLDLPEASTTFYYSNDYHLISRLQSEDRNHRIGSIKTVTYLDIFAVDTVDSKIIKALKEKFDIASKLTGDELRSWLK